jgi:PLP dependent protein
VTETLAHTYEALLIRARRACERVQRDPAELRFIAVSKHQPVALIEAAYEAGCRDFGENYVQELVEKRAALSHLSDVRWHLIGHLQRNKVRLALSALHCIHTLDSERLVREVAQRALDRGLEVEAFVEVNVAGEAQKHGCREEELPALVALIRESPSLKLCGLMTIPPQTDDAETGRTYFRALRNLAARQSLPRLSMGMSSDFEVAIEEGATDVRVGTALFGTRQRS